MNINWWQDLSVDWQDCIIFIAYLTPLFFVGIFLFYRLRPYTMIKTLLKRYKKVNVLIVIILGACLSISIAIKATTHSYKTAMAKVANRFELVVTAPGSKVDMMLSTVYLQPTATPLLKGDIYEKIANDKKVAITAPIAFGDSYHGFPVIGSTNSFIQYLSENKVSGSYFNNKNEAIIGAGVDLEIGDTFTPQHGIHRNFASQYARKKTKSIREVKPVEKQKKDYFCPDNNSNKNQSEITFTKKRSNAFANKTSFSIASRTSINNAKKNIVTDKSEQNQNHHHHTSITVVGKMPITHSPWDKAIITPVESVWSIHGLPNGHPPGDNSLGEPFDMDYFSGTPAILVHPKKRFQSFVLSKKYTNSKSMAFIPPTVLNKLNSQLDDVTDVFSRVATLTIILVLSLVTITIALLGKLFEKNFQLLQLLGSPKRFIMSIMWGYVTALAFLSTVFGCILGYLLTSILSHHIEKKLSVLLEVQFGWTELILCSMFFTATSLLGLILAFMSNKPSS